MRRAPAIAPSSSSQRTSRQRTCSTAGSWSVCNAPCGEARIACAVWHGGHTAPEDGATLPAAHLNHHSASVSSPIPSSVAGTSPRPGIPSIAHRCTAEGEKRPMWSKARELSTFRRVAPILHGTCCWNRLTMPGSCREATGAVIRSNAADSHLRPRIATPSIFRVKIALCGFPSATQRDVSLHIAWYGRHSNHRTAILQ